MSKDISKLTIAQFAKMHDVNKRTLHYYDEIDLFSPIKKNEHGYRMYDMSQSLDFEYIKMLKELDMSIEEIKDYYNHPSSEKFLEIAENKLKELDYKISQLNHLKETLQLKQQQLLFCNTLKEQEIKIEDFAGTQLSTLSLDDEKDISLLFSACKKHWDIEQIRKGIGGYLSLQKVKNNNFKYDGFFTYANKKGNMKLPKGKYLCGYQKGTRQDIPKIYKKMLEFAKEYHLELADNAYEIGLNEFAISDKAEYITKIMIELK